MFFSSLRMTSVCCIVRTISGLCCWVEPRSPGPQIQESQESTQGCTAQAGSAQPSRYLFMFIFVTSSAVSRYFQSFYAKLGYCGCSTYCFIFKAKEVKNSSIIKNWSICSLLISIDPSSAELPPPPAPPPTDDSLQLLADVLSRSRTDCERKEGSDSPTLHKRAEHFSPQRRGPAKWSSQGEYDMWYCDNRSMSVPSAYAVFFNSQSLVNAY